MAVNKFSCFDLKSISWARVVDPHSFFADPDPAVFLNVDPDPAAFFWRIRIQLNKTCKINLMKSFLELKKTKKRLLQNKRKKS